MKTPRPTLKRRTFIKRSAAAAAVFQIVPRRVLGGPGHTPPSETFGGALIGCGGRGPGTFQELSKGHAVTQLAWCDVKFKDKADNKTHYTDYRRVLERKDIDLIAIATPPHWHAPISIAAAEAGKDVICEKPMTHSIGEGRAVIDAFQRYGRIFQIGTFGRFGASTSRSNQEKHKIMRSGLLDPCDVVVIQKGGLKVKQWSGRIDLPPRDIPANVDWDLYCGPSPLKAYNGPRLGGTHRWYWDYEGGGLSDMGQHSLDPLQWIYGKDDTSPVEIESFAPPAHPEVTGMWAWVEMKYADGMTLVLDSGEWDEPYSRKTPKGTGLKALSAEQQEKLKALPDPEPLRSFAEAVKTRLQPGGDAESSHRSATLLHLANIAIRTGRKIHYDPVQEQIVGDEVANRLVNQPMRAPWHL